MSTINIPSGMWEVGKPIWAKPPQAWTSGYFTYKSEQKQMTKEATTFKGGVRVFMAAAITRGDEPTVLFGPALILARDEQAAHAQAGADVAGRGVAVKDVEILVRPF